MDEFTEELETLKARCDAIVDQFTAKDVESSTKAFIESAENAGKAWSGSWLGYQSRVYYNNLDPVPPGARFSKEYGFSEAFRRGTAGDWIEYAFDDLVENITSIKTAKTITELQEDAKVAAEAVEEVRDSLMSIAESFSAQREDAYLQKIKGQIEKTQVYSAADYVKSQTPHGKFFSRDMMAMESGIEAPPHICVSARILSINSPKNAAEKLRKLTTQLMQHLAHRKQSTKGITDPGTHVFIGHGRSLLWKDLKDFISDRMQLPYDEFNRVPVAGVTNVVRLSEMLDSAAIAFVVMTAEDEQADGNLHARMNVIHEVGLFQGRLGFSRAIVVLESTCAEFSNIQGLGQIRFEKGNIKSCFEEIRQVLEREGLA